MANVNNYKCPCCSGTMRYDSKANQVVCEYCGSEYSAAEVENMMDNSSDSSTIDKPDEWTCNATGWEPDGMNAYSCPSCGAQLVCDENTAAGSCPYCGNPTIVPERFEGTLRPEYIIPFKIEKDAVNAKLEKFYKRKLFLPKEFKVSNDVHEVSGVYVPFWLYDGIAYEEAVYRAEKVSHHRHGDYEIEKTDHYAVIRKGEVAFEKIPADASTKMPDELMDSIEPYDYKGLVPFSKGYMAGYVADKYDVTKEENAKRAKSRAEKTIMKLVDDTVTGYTNKTRTMCNTRVREGKISYAMLPVWMLSTKYKNKNYIFAMNGQTGKMVGELPMDKLKALIVTLIFYLVPFAIAAILNGGFETNSTGKMIGLFIGLPMVFAILAFFGFKSQLKNVRVAQTSNNYIVGKGLKLTVKHDKFIRSTEKKRKINNN